jgi:uncharacterized protein (TIGR00661 family)
VKILYGVVGEGMGHAMRSRVILEHLLEEGHQLEIMASGRAVDFLKKRFETEGSAAGVTSIHGLHMIYEENRVRRGKTLWSNVLTGATGVPKNIAAYFELLSSFRPQAVVSDFESWTYLFGKAHRLPVFSVDNMQIINRCELPDAVIGPYRSEFEVTKAFIKSKLPRADHYFIATFFRPPLRKDRTTPRAPDPAPGDPGREGPSAGSTCSCTRPPRATRRSRRRCRPPGSSAASTA